MWCLRVTREPPPPVEGADWEKFLKLAESHGVRPLVHQALAEASPPELTQFFRANAIRNLYLTAELLRLLRLLDAHAIRAVPLKGPALAQSLYGDLALREFGDLDVLVQEPDLRKATELLEAQGYHLDAALDPRGEAAHIRNDQDFPFHHPAKGILIELHWRFTPRWFAFPISPAQVWLRLQPIPLAGREVPSLCPEHLFLFLAAHGAKHRWCALKWLCDLAQLIHRHPRLDWDWIVDQARRAHATRVLLLAVHLAAQLGAPVPPELHGRARRDPKVQALAADIWRDIENPAGLDELGLFLWGLKVQDRWRDRSLRCLLILTRPTAADQAFLPLPRSLSFLHILTHPIRILSQRILRR
jgi:hypothetical protein